MASTMKDIARETGLGLATISSYLNGGNVREKNRIKIEEAIEKLHYEVNETARGLKTDRTQTIGVVIPELRSSFCAKILSVVEDQMQELGYGMIISDCRTDKDREKKAVEFLLRKRVDILLNIPVDETGAHLLPFLEAGKPVILLDREIPGLGCDVVQADNYEALYLATGLLTGKGHRKIAAVIGPEKIFTTRERRRGFVDACRAAGIAEEEIRLVDGHDTIEGAAEAVRSLLSCEPDLTGLVVTNNAMTIGTMIGLNEMGIAVPDQVSVVGFDNRHFARACRPTLSIVDQPETEMAHQIVRLMKKRLKEGNDGVREKIRLSVHVEEGASVRQL